MAMHFLLSGVGKVQPSVSCFFNSSSLLSFFLFFLFFIAASFYSSFPTFSLFHSAPAVSLLAFEELLDKVTYK